MDSATGVRSCAPGATNLGSHQPRHQGRRDSRLRYSSSSSEGVEDGDRLRPSSRYMADQQPSSGGGNDSGIGNVRQRMNGNATSDDHSSSIDRLTGGPGGEVQRLYNYLSAGSESDDASSGIGGSATRDSRRPPRSSSARRRRHEQQRQRDRQLAGQLPQQSIEMESLTTSGQVGFDERLHDVSGSDRRVVPEFGRRQSRYRSGTDSINSSKASENFYSRISEDTLPLPTGVANPMTSSRPNLFLPPPPPVESCPPMPPRRIMTTFGTQTADRSTALRHSAADLAADMENDDPVQTQFLVQTPFGHVFAPSSQVNTVFSSSTSPRHGAPSSLTTSGHRTVAARPSNAAVQYHHHPDRLQQQQQQQQQQQPGGPTWSAVDSRGTSAMTSQVGTSTGEQSQSQSVVDHFSRPSVVVDSTSTGFVSGLNRGFNAGRTDRVGTTLPVYPTTGSTRKETTSGSSKRFPFVAGCKVKRQLERRCHWRCVSMILVVVSLVLIALIAYLIAMKVNNLSWSLEKEALLVERQTTSRPSISPLLVPEQGPTSSVHVTGPIDQYQIGTQTQQFVGPNEFWPLTFFLRDSVTLRLNASIARTTVDDDDVISGVAAIGIYGRRGLPPTHARYDFFRVADVTGSSRRRRRAHHIASRSVEGDKAQQLVFVQYMEGGLWYVFIYNESPHTRLVTFETTNHEVPTAGGCLNNCNGRGDCVEGLCRCYSGYSGPNCSDSDCVPLCNGRGLYIRGVCRCHGGWSGAACQLASRDCDDPTCGGGNGQCVDGRCVCAAGFQGTNCTEEVCTVLCIHGNCRDQRCVCDDQWEGSACDVRRCDPRCSLHGSCHNGTCHCEPGWNGRHCSLDGCPQSCNGHGICRRQLTGDWSCACDEGWSSAGCSVAMETVCDGDVDDDEDGATDCLDPDCCLSAACRDKGNCQMSPDPMEILLRKQPPSSTASFYERMKFLIEDDSVQSYATLSSFNPSQVSVIRGRVVGVDGVSLVGVRVSIVTQPLYGFTLTRDLGQFDILVNGGGSVTVLFQRPPFKPRQVTVMVPWNRMVTMETVVLAIEGRPGSVTSEETCPPSVIHDYRRMKPTVLSTWQHTQLGSCPSRSTVIPESQVVKESLQIPGTGVYLVYHSSTAPGYMSIIMIQLTPDIIPLNLAVIHLKVTIEGLVSEKVFEAEASLKYKFSWDRRNAYKQKVYGIVSANVGVGYQYEGCKQIFWETRSATLSGYDISSSEIGGWNLNIHHMYNFQEGILHKGDGTNVFLKERPRRMSTILGNGKIRRVDCRGCDGKADEARLMAPVALASGRDGSLYVGDFNYIRRLNAARDEVTSILQLNMSEVPYKYYMTVSPLDGKLYISDYRTLRIFRVKTMGSVRDLTQNAEVIAGTGDQCIPGQPNLCGDGGLAVNAQLFHPKGLAINKDGVMYFADGPNIRSIDVSGRITTVIGSQGPLRYWQPFHCDAVLLSTEVMLYWPTALAINPLDDTLHVLDSSMVLKLTRHGHMFPVAGRANHCPPSNHNLRSQLLLDRESASTRLATDLPLVRPQHIAFSPAGDLYIVEEGNGGGSESSGAGTRSVNRIRVVDSSGVLLDYVGGGTQSCDCRQSTVGNVTGECQCQSSRDDVANESRLGAPTAVTVTPDGIVHVADMGNLRVHSIVVALPAADRITGYYDVIDDTVQEHYTFNRFGQHVSTRHILTSSVLYNFTYNVNSYYGKLVRVSDASFPPVAPTSTTGNTIVIKRDYRLLAQDITPPGGQGLRCRLAMDNVGHLSMFSTTADNTTMKFEYSGNTGLMTSKEDTKTGRVHRYEYDKTGRISVVVNPTGSRTQFDTDVDQSGAVVRVSDGSSREGSGGSTALATNGNVLTLVLGDYRMKVSQHGDRSLTLEYPFKMAVALETIPHPLLGAEYRLQARRQIVLPDNLVHRFEWRYYQRPDGQSRRTKTTDRVIGRQMKVNGETVLAFEYDRVNRTETVLDRQHEGLLVLHYDASGRIIQVSPRSSVSGLRVGYELNGRISRWSRGGLNVSMTYDERGRLTERRFGARTVYKYVYRNNSKTTEVQLPSGRQYQLLYDSNLNLRSVVTPGLSSHQFGRLISPVIDRDIYWPPSIRSGIVSSAGSSPESKEAFVSDYDAAGRLLRTSYPSGRRRTVHRYGPAGHLSVVAFDQTNVEYRYHPESMKLTRIESVDLVTGNSSFVLDFGNATEALVTSHDVTPPADASLAYARFRYAYDAHMRVSWTNSTVGDVVLPALPFEYSVETGQLVKMAAFDFRSESTSTGRRTVAQDLNIEIARDLDGVGKVTDVSYTFSSYIVFVLEVKYDELGRILQWRRKVGSSDLRVVEFVYDVDSHVTEVIVNGQSTWRYETDSDGNVVQRSLHGNARPILMNGRGQVLQSASGKSYVYDVDGFVIRRDEETFVWNSLGRLIQTSSTAADSDGHSTTYRYDSLGRLASIETRKNSSTSPPVVTVAIQLFYGDLGHVDRVTHVLDRLTAIVVQLMYDDDGRLFAMLRNGADVYYVATDPHDTPIVVFSSTGGVVKQIDYDPLGSVLADTASQLDFPLVIGYRGAIWDSTSRILFFDAGATVYDPELGSWMAPDYRGLVARGMFEKDVLDLPQLVNFYQTGFLTHRLLGKRSFPLTDISDWLHAVGYNYNSLVPAVSFDGRVGQPPEDACRHRREVTSAFHCAYDRESRAFSASSRLVALSSVVAAANGDESSSVADSDTSSFASIPYVFGTGVRTSVDESQSVSIELAGSQLQGTSLLPLANVLLNNSRAVGVGYLFENGRSVDYFVKKVGSIDRVDEDLRSAGLDPHSGGELDAAGVNVTIVRHGQRRHHRGENVDVRVRGAHSTVVVRYTEHSPDDGEMQDWVTSAAEERAVEAAWDVARRQIAENDVPQSGSTRYVWNRAQREQLLISGRVSGVRVEYVRSPSLWPEFADDPANVRFVSDD